MGVVVNMVFAIAMVAAAAGAIAELQIRMGGIGAATDGAFMPIGLLTGFAPVVFGPVWIGLLLFLPEITERFLASAAPGLQEIRQDMQNIGTKE